MKQIELTQGCIAIVDDADYEWLSLWKWHYNSGYARRKEHLGYVDGKRKTRAIYMHREVACAPYGLEVDHINQDTLDNRRDNLRLANRSQNQANQKVGTDNTSGFKGVYRNRNKWCARIYHQNKRYYIGTFNNPIEAAKAYDVKALELFGEFACTNNPDDTPPNQ